MRTLLTMGLLIALVGCGSAPDAESEGVWSASAPLYQAGQAPTYDVDGKKPKNYYRRRRIVQYCDGDDSGNHCDKDSATCPGCEECTDRVDEREPLREGEDCETFFCDEDTKMAHVGTVVKRLGVLYCLGGAGPVPEL